MTVELRTEMKGDILVVEIIGDALDASNVQQFKNGIIRLIEGKKDVVFDFTAVKFVDSSGIGALLAVKRTVKPLNGDVRFCSLRPSVAKIFETVRMTKVISTFDTQDLAIASFSA